ncbi:MAG: MerR family transcriptional regulator [Alphaproteobacteria bacterium]
MKTYSIGEVAKLMGLTTHTLRFYDKEGLLPNVRKNSAGLRRFTEEDINWLLILDCLKSTGLPLKEIRYYIELAQQGSKTLSERREMFIRQKERIKQQMEVLKHNMEKINFKIQYYDEAIKNGEENIFQKNKHLADEKKRLFKLSVNKN